MIQLEKLRMARGYTRQELADASGTTRVSIYRYESGKRVPDLLAAKRIARALDCSLDELVPDDPDNILPRMG